jgi:hypothetical protein
MIIHFAIKNQEFTKQKTVIYDMLMCYLWVRLPSLECPQDPTTAGHTSARRAAPTQQNSSMPHIYFPDKYIEVSGPDSNGLWIRIRQEGWMFSSENWRHFQNSFFPPKFLLNFWPSKIKIRTNGSGFN